MSRPRLPMFCARPELLAHWRAWLSRHVSASAETVRIVRRVA